MRLILLACVACASAPVAHETCLRDVVHHGNGRNGGYSEYYLLDQPIPREAFYDTLTEDMGVRADLARSHALERKSDTAVYTGTFGLVAVFGATAAAALLGGAKPAFAIGVPLVAADGVALGLGIHWAGQADDERRRAIARYNADADAKGCPVP